MAKAVTKPDFPERKNGGIGGKKSKNSGRNFEYMTEDFFNTDISKARRIIGSGAFGVISREPRLLGDVHIKFDILNKPILAEAKWGYGGPTQITLKREWVEKIIQQSEVAGKYPALIFKFKGARGKSAKMIAFDWETFIEIMRTLTKKFEDN
jgi:hypothetical protein